ncbi:MAG: hypothetical protein IIY32_05055 [Thermoguttaceae bacterium]|nr:hypothetical protein [Thermoguttaceae bacterium]
MISQKLDKVFLFDREPLRKRLEQLRQEFDRLAKKRAKELEKREEQSPEGEADGKNPQNCPKQEQDGS